MSDLPTPPHGCAFEELTEEEAQLVKANELDPETYLVMRLPPINNPMQMQVLDDGSIALLQPFHLPAGAMKWQAATKILGPGGQPTAQMQPGDFLAIEMRIVTRRSALVERTELPPLPNLTPLEASNGE